MDGGGPGRDQKPGLLQDLHSQQRNTNILVVITLIVSLCALIIGLIDIKGDAMEEALESTGTDTISSDAVSGSSALPGFESLAWEDIEALAQTQTLNFYLWSPEASSPRVWMDDFVTPQLADKGITVNRIDAVYADCDLSSMALSCDVTDEIAAGNAESGGAVDLVWINGANFATMKDLGLLYGPFAQLLPNSQNFDFTDSSIAFDHGVSTAGLEFPLNSAQSVFIYDEATIPSPPMNIPDLRDWIIANPGKFAYSDASTDFTGAGFVRHFFYHYGGDDVGSYTDLLVDFDEDLYNERAPAVWAALNELEDYMYKPDGVSDAWYPTAHSEIRDLVGNGTLTMDFSFQASEASTQIQDELNPWPETMQAYVLDTGTISDTNYLAIPVNAQNKEAALVAVNHIASAGQMFVRSQPEVWGALQAFDPTAPSMVEWDVAFDYILTHEATPTMEELAAGRLSDMNGDWIDRINADWVTFVRDA